jgi:hypothetical protein
LHTFKIDHYRIIILLGITFSGIGNRVIKMRVSRLPFEVWFPAQTVRDVINKNVELFFILIFHLKGHSQAFGWCFSPATQSFLLLTMSWMVLSAPVFSKPHTVLFQLLGGQAHCPADAGGKKLSLGWGDRTCAELASVGPHLLVCANATDFCS